MILKPAAESLSFRQGESVFSFLQSGDVFEFTFGRMLINQLRGSAPGPSANNIWLRVYAGEKPLVHPLLGVRSGSALSRAPDRLFYTGAFMNISYRVTFCAAAEGLWFWTVELEGSGERADLLYGQDIGVAARGGVLTNELYMAQYLDHRPLTGENGYAVCSRQNQEQEGAFPYLQQGMIRGRAIAYATDGLQFFGLASRAGAEGGALFEDLPGRKYQGEFSYTALQSERLELRGRHTLAFYGLFLPDHPEAVRELEYTGRVGAAYKAAFPEGPAAGKTGKGPERIGPVKIREEFGGPYSSPPWDEARLGGLYPARKLEEREGGRLLSFFTPDHAHVVMQEKELLTERPHGTIITTALNPETADQRLITSTAYMYGVFNGQVAAGNTSFHKCISVPRGLLNVQKTSGQRIYVKTGGTFRLLALPAVFEMGMNYARWFYTLPEGTLMISSFTAAEAADLALELRFLEGGPLDFIITQQLVMGEHEFLAPVELEQTGEGPSPILRFRQDTLTRRRSPYPGLHYDLQIPGVPYGWNDDRIFYGDGEPRNGTLLTLEIRGRDRFQMIIQGRLEEEAAAPRGGYDFEEEKEKHARFWGRFTRGFHLEGAGEEAEILNETVRWFSHNAMVHFAVPHGLEQSGGAAWGTRDVCQGPVEYFLAFGHFPLARSCLLRVFSHQSSGTHEWPQWFMFDRYPLNAGECHGDVIFWPLKALGDYIEDSGDESILYEELPYTAPDGRPGAEQEAVLLHVRKALDRVEARFVRDTALLSYAGGDWDDTLQPADEKLKERMVSAWTQALGIQTLRTLERALQPADREYALHLGGLADRMTGAFERYLIKDGVIAGFLCFNGEGSPEYLLHPDDRTTGIHYRLLPLTRSVIAGIVDRDQARRNMELIDRRLKAPDGVRLMDKPARYDGGPSRLFRRAEQAANVGREIGLQYVHAHIRYLEALAKLGRGGELWDGLFRVNPVKLASRLPRALPRQNNMYFSSSDGDFADRYEFGEQFGLLREGKIPVKGGWRLYSSGPGIYLRQLVSNILGIRFYRGGLLIDPVLPPALEGLRFTFTCYDRETVFVYRLNGGAENTRLVRNGKTLAAEARPNPYRRGAVLLGREEFLKEPGEISVYPAAAPV